MAQIRSQRDDEAEVLSGGRKMLARGPQKPYDGSSPLPVRSNGMALTLRPRASVAASRRAFAPAGQSTQLIVGATPEDDNHILQLSHSLYEKFDLKRVFFSAYMPIMDDERLPGAETPVPLRREHRLYQADWLMRYYAFSPDELATPETPWLDLEVDPKLAWALRNIDRFPVEVMDAPLELLLRVPGIGPVGARRIVRARRSKRLGFDDLRALNITLKRARHFLTCAGARDPKSPLDPELIRGKVMEDAQASAYNRTRRSIEAAQPRLF
jgi:predicted DNA-binding helix-hairpin-helix protein